MPGTNYVVGTMERMIFYRGNSSYSDAFNQAAIEIRGVKRESEEKFFDFMRNKNIDLTKPNGKMTLINVNINEDREKELEFKINPLFVQREKQLERAKGWEVAFDTKKELLFNNSKTIDYLTGKYPNRNELRNISGLFAIKGNEEEQNKMKEDIDFYSDPFISTPEKQERFHKYIKTKFEKVASICTKPANNKELLDKYHEVMVETWPFMTETSTDGTRFFGFEPTEETKELYNTARSYSQTLTSIYNTKMDIVMDPGYPFIDETAYKKIGELGTLDVFESLEISRQGNIVSPINDLGVGYTNTIALKNRGRDTNGKFFVEKYQLDSSMRFFDKTGEINIFELKNALDRNERVEIVRENGLHQTIELDEYGLQKPASSTIPLFDQEHKDTYKALYKDCLTKLNSATALFNKSSKEYKDMRKELGKMIDKKNPTKEDFIRSVGFLKTQIENYDKNYAKKESLTELAYKRKAAVDFTHNIIDNMDSALQIDGNLVKEASAERARNDMQRQINNLREEDMVSENGNYIEAGDRVPLDLSEDQELEFSNNQQSNDFIVARESKFDNEVDRERDDIVIGGNNNQ